MFSRGMRQALAAYDAMLTSHPVRTKMATSITLAGFGDSCVQRMQLGKQDDSAAAVQREEGADGAGPAVADAAAAFGEVERSAHTWDAERTARQIFWSGSFSPVLHFWFGALARVPQISIIPPALVTVALDQAFFVLQGGGIEDCKTEVNAKFWEAIKVNWCVWPLAIFVNVTFVPLPYRVLFVNCIGLGYGSFLSYAANDLQVASANEGGEGVSIGDTDVLVSEHPR
eukprot:gene5317-7797_t